jgi:predicted TIM-barrel fold metal-dependent hydrolase
MAWTNVHEHLESTQELAVLLGAMDDSGIERVVLLGSSAFTITSNYHLGFTKYDENNREIIKAAKTHGDRIEAWPTLNPLDRDNIDKLRTYHEMGASGLKLYLGHGFVSPNSLEYLFGPVAMDDPRMDDIYEYCCAHRLPICLHVNPGPNTPGFAEEFVALLERYPRLLVNAPHWMLSTGRPERLAELLEVFPNLVTDVSLGTDKFLIAGLRRISHNARCIRQLVERHPSRFMFGTDFVVTSCHHKTIDWMRARVQAYLSMLACSQYDSPLAPGEILTGLALPSSVLQQIASTSYSRFRALDRHLTPPRRPVDWLRLGVHRSSRRPGERLRPQSVSHGMALSNIRQRPKGLEAERSPKGSAI